jgi:hypothetical protein
MYICLVNSSNPFLILTYVKAGLAAGAKAAVEATTAAKQKAVFMMNSTNNELWFPLHPLKQRSMAKQTEKRETYETSIS